MGIYWLGSRDECLSESFDGVWRPFVPQEKGSLLRQVDRSYLGLYFFNGRDTRLTVHLQI